MIFYNNLSQNELNDLYKTMNKDKSLRKQRIKYGLSLFKSKDEYVSYLIKLKQQHELLVNGTKDNNFLI